MWKRPISIFHTKLVRKLPCANIDEKDHASVIFAHALPTPTAGTKMRARDGNMIKYCQRNEMNEIVQKQFVRETEIEFRALHHHGAVAEPFVETANQNFQNEGLSLEIAVSFELHPKIVDVCHRRRPKSQ